MHNNLKDSALEERKWINYNGILYQGDDMLFPLKQIPLSLFSQFIPIYQERILFWEEHYFSLMSSMRILRLEIPMEYTPSYLEEEIYKTIKKNKDNNQGNSFCNVAFFIFRDHHKKPTFLIDLADKSSKKNTFSFNITNEDYKIDFYKDFKIPVDFFLINQISFSFQPYWELARSYVKENQLDDIIFLNNQNGIVQTLDAYIFLIKDNYIFTPKLEEGLRKDIIRKKFITFMNQQQEFNLQETKVSPLELQSSYEVFFLENLSIKAISSFRKKQYNSHSLSKKIFDQWKVFIEEQLQE